ncbi:MAG: NAD-dependent epimerase/dehydratase family protein, partial [Cycloclasticus sp.]|nr:NAD-dependent epimerase/dehydratase family protein [Cycloclasticus sp.]
MSCTLITGGTGLIGSALCRYLTSLHHSVIVLSRRPETVAEKCGPTVTAVKSLD